MQLLRAPVAAAPALWFQQNRMPIAAFLHRGCTSTMLTPTLTADARIGSSKIQYRSQHFCAMDAAPPWMLALVPAKSRCRSQQNASPVPANRTAGCSRTTHHPSKKIAPAAGGLQPWFHHRRCSNSRSRFQLCHRMVPANCSPPVVALSVDAHRSLIGPREELGGSETIGRTRAVGICGGGQAGVGCRWREGG